MVLSNLFDNFEIVRHDKYRIKIALAGVCDHLSLFFVRFPLRDPTAESGKFMSSGVRTALITVCKVFAEFEHIIPSRLRPTSF